MGVQGRLFFRSKLRLILLGVLLAGTLRHVIQAMIYMHGQGNYGKLDIILGTHQRQMGDCIYIFILLMFLAFDYFRESSEANALEIVRVNGNYLREDMKSFLVMAGLLAAYSSLLIISYGAAVFFTVGITGEVFIYFVKVIGLYFFLNGLVAVLIGWLLARVVGRLIGYLCMICIACLVSPILTMSLSYFAMWYREIFRWFRIFIIMPQGTETVNPYVMFTVNLSLTARTFFWLGALVLLLMVHYSVAAHRWRTPQWGILVAGLACMTGAWIYSGLPTSFYNNEKSLASTDSTAYDQWRYVVDETTQQSTESFRVQSYVMKLKFRRQMEAEVTIYLDDHDLNTYAMTLYHLYQIDSITDEEGTELPYQRNGDYLIVERQEKGLEAITVRYHGGCANFYSNQTQVNLPGWFCYYPIPGWHELYDAENFEYYCNVLEYPVPFDIDIDAKATIYSELERVEGNHFQGRDVGPSFVAGYVKEYCTEDGIRIVYPYLDSMNNPSSEIRTEDFQTVLDGMRTLGKKTLLFMPSLSGDLPMMNQGDYMVSSRGIGVLSMWYSEMGDFIPYVAEYTEEDAIEGFLISYSIAANEPELNSYEQILQTYMNYMSEWEYTEDDFEDFFIKYLGEDEWNAMKERGGYVED